MKQIRKINQQQQTELFFELDPSSSPIRVELPIHQETELKKAIAELLLGIARRKQRQTGGGDDA
jgi:hypothetical protein